MIRHTLEFMKANQKAMDKHGKRISTGQKIFTALDDPAGDTMSTMMRYDLRALDEAIRNTQNNQAMLRVANGVLENTKDLLNSIKEKAIFAADDTATDTDRKIAEKEILQFIDQIDDNSKITYNKKTLIDGSHHRQSIGTTQALTNLELAEDTTAQTKLTELTRRAGDNLNINETDRINVSYVKDAQTYHTSYVVGNMTMGSVFDGVNKINGVVFDLKDMGKTNVVGLDVTG